MSRYLPRKTKERVVNALVTSRLDYCNTLMHGTTQHNLDNYRECRTRQQDSWSEHPSLATWQILWWICTGCQSVPGSATRYVCWRIRLFTAWAQSTYGNLICLYMPGRSLRSGDSLQLHSQASDRDKGRGCCLFSCCSRSEEWSAYHHQRNHDEDPFFNKH